MEDLSSEEKKAVAALVSPDAQRAVHFNWDENFQRRIIGLLLTEKSFIIQTASLIKPQYFNSTIHQEITRVVFDYFESYTQLMPRFMVEEKIKESVKKQDSVVQSYWISELSNIYDAFVPEITVMEPLIDKVLAFAKGQALRIAMLKASDKLKTSLSDSNVWEQIQGYFNEALLINRNFSIGIDLFVNTDEFFKRMIKGFEVTDLFTSSFKTIDDNLDRRGLSRGELYGWLGFPGTGKSLLLCTIGVRNVKQNKKVLYISCEMSEVDVCARFAAQFTRTGVGDILENRESIENMMATHIKDLDQKSLFLVKQFPSGMASLADIRAYINQLHLRDWRPDMVILDYVGEVKIEANKHVAGWEAKYVLMRDLRGMCQVYDFVGITAIQPNRSGADHGTAEYLDEGNIGGSFDQVKPLDGLWSINQKNEERKAHVARGFIAKHRQGKSKVPFYVRFDPKTYEMFEITHDQYRQAMQDLISREAGENPVAVNGAGTPAPSPKGKFKGRTSNFKSGNFDDDD